jgi:hypothetical protein
MTRRSVLQLVACTVLLAGLAAGTAGFLEELRAVYRRENASRILTPELAERVRYIRSRIPPEVEILYVSFRQPPDAWHSRLWQRVLYPTRVVIVEGDQAPAGPGKAARFALAAGNPPPDLAFRWRVAFRPLPGEAETLWFGELSP